MLDKHRRNGEWFEVSPDAAVCAIHSVAYRRGQPVLDLDATQAEQIVQIARSMPLESKPPPAWQRVGMIALQVIGGVIIAAAAIAFLAIRLI
jgi:hypothetical protein